MRGDDFDAQVRGVAALAEPMRRALYRYVVDQPRPVSRDQAADGVGVSRHVAKFHLDKLQDEGLLEVEYRRPPGRGGPGAGRPAKLYRRSSRELAVSLPERRYELAGRVLVEAIEDAERDGVAIAEALRTAAERAGRALGDEARRRAGADAGRAAQADAGADAGRAAQADAGADAGRAAQADTARGMLAELGYEPRADDGGLILANCPFHVLAQDYTEVVCGMNLDLIDGLLAGLELADLRARLDPAPGRCCVTVRPRAAVQEEAS
jgi:predicted ArsR family transcriptional regulator